MTRQLAPSAPAAPAAPSVRGPGRLPGGAGPRRRAGAAPRAALGVAAAALAGAAGTGPASADPTRGIDAALFRGAYDAGGVLALEGARLAPRRDLSLKAMLGYGRRPVAAPVPGIGDGGSDAILDYLMTLDVALGLTLTDRVAIGVAIAAYRTTTGAGYGERGRYLAGGVLERRSTGLLALRPLSNLDPSADRGDEAAFLGDGLAGPLDARAGIKLALHRGPRVAVAALASVFLPFGEDEMLLGDRGVVYEPKLAVELRPSALSGTRVVGNIAARLRRRTILEAYDSAAEPVGDPAAAARVFLDVGSEVVIGGGGSYELSPRLSLAGEAQLFVPLPGALSYGACRRYSGAPCDSLASGDYVAGAGAGDLVLLVAGGASYRITADVAATAMIGAAVVGDRGEAVRLATGLVWAPQPIGAAAPGRADRDGDGTPNTVDACPDEAEDADSFEDEDGCPERDNDRDGTADAADGCPNEAEDRDDFEDEDGCPERDNDLDAVPDATDRCPDAAEDTDGFEDEDGCPEEDNDGDGFGDARDRCPNDAETLNGIDDDDGCPDVRGAAGPEERADRIDLRGAPLAFVRGTATLTAPSRGTLAQVAALIRARRLAIRVEVHVALGTRSQVAAQIAAQRRRDRALSQQRARAILDALIALGVPLPQLQAVGVGSERPLGAGGPTDAIHERVDLIKSQQGGAP